MGRRDAGNELKAAVIKTSQHRQNQAERRNPARTVETRCERPVNDSHSPATHH